MFSTVVERFTTVAGELMDRIRTVLPEGSTKCRIRTRPRESRDPVTGSLRETLGEMESGMVFLDPTGVPMKYDQPGTLLRCKTWFMKAHPLGALRLRSCVSLRMKIYSEAIGAIACRTEVDVPGALPNSWQPSGALDTANLNLSDERKHAISQGARHILWVSWVSASDPHYDAKGTSFF